MNEKKHIDRLFQEKFKNFEVSPDDAVWDNIHSALHKDTRKRRVIPLWWWMGGVAAALIFLFALRPLLFSHDEFNTPETNVVDTETPKRGSGFKKSPVDDTTQPENQNLPDLNKIKRSNILNNTNASEVADINARGDLNNSPTPDKHPSKASTVRKESKSANAHDAIAQHNIYPDHQKATDKNSHYSSTIINSVSEIRNKTPKIVDHNSPPINQLSDPILEDHTTIPETGESIEEAIANSYPIIEKEKEKEEQSNRWNISPNVAPVYFSDLGTGSPIHSQFVNNSKSGEVHMSYGISGSYAINDKLKIRAGINKVDLGYRTNDVMAFRDIQSFNTNSGANTLPNINFIHQQNADVFMSASNIKNKSAPQFLVSNPTGTLEQQFGYIEVPLELEYSLINKKFGLNVIGGFSTFFLNSNNVYAVIENERSLLGDANNINNTSHSANVGLGLNYNISSSLKLNLEPMFKYQINTFNNTSGDFRPYFIGVYSGFSFKF